MTLPDAIQSRLSALKTRLSKCERKLDRLLRAEKFEERERVRDEEFIKIFKDGCALVREAEIADAPYLFELAKAADEIFDGGVGYSYGKDSDAIDLDEEEELYDFMPSWAHDDDGGRPLIKDENGGKFPLPHAALESLTQLLQSRLSGDAKALDTFKTEPWDASSKRHPKSTNLSRFRPDLPALTPTLDKPLAASVLDARCEITSSSCPSPIRFHIGLGNTCLALTGLGGYKYRSTALEYIIPNQPLAPGSPFPIVHHIVPRLSSLTYHAAVDETRRLVIVGDDRRIKSYEWGSPSETYQDAVLIHTLDTQRSQGPMTVLPNGSVVRAGKGGASVWNLESLVNNDDNVEEQIQEAGGSDDDEDWEDEDSEDEDSEDGYPEGFDRSPGSAPTSHIKFLDQPTLKPNLWQPLLAAPSTVLCVEDPQLEGSYSCIGIDLETGKSTSYYLGHGDEVSAFSVSPADPNIFLTACNDGFARLFDARRPLPVVIFDACGQEEVCEAAALAHPDSIPIVFSGTHKGEQIKVWDVRARACVYELATGNNAVQSLAWDAQNNCLYAATECEHVNRLGYDSDYRFAKVPKGQSPGAAKDEVDFERRWPKQAWHKEDYFGHLFDAGEHRILRYAFKEDPSPSVVPTYGDA